MVKLGFWTERLIVNANALFWVFVGYRICLSFLKRQNKNEKRLEDAEKRAFEYQKIYKACKEFEFIYNCRTMIDYEDASMIRVYSIPDIKSTYKIEDLKEIIERNLGYKYKGFIVEDRHLTYSIDEHLA